MTAAGVIQPSASIASTGKSIRYIGDYAYAYSGLVENAAGGGGNPSTLLEFTTGSGLIVANISWGIKHGGGSDSYFTVKLNDLDVFNATATTTGGAIPFTPLTFIIPPFTKVEVLWGIDAVTEDGTSQFTGRVYGAE